MGKYRMGAVIKLSRVAQGLSQENLSEDICSVETLSRIENGKQKPSKAIYEKLMLRLGKEKEQSYLNFEIDQFEYLDQFDEIKDLLYLKKINEAEKLMHELKNKLSGESIMNRQYFILIQATISFYKKTISACEFKNSLEEALLLTLPYYNMADKKMIPYSEREIHILLNMTWAYERLGDIITALEIIEQLEAALNQNYMYGEGEIRLIINILFAKSKYLELLKRHNETISIFEQGIHS